MGICFHRNPVLPTGHPTHPHPEPSLFSSLESLGPMPPTSGAWIGRWGGYDLGSVVTGP